MAACATPVPFEQLVALWSGDLAADDADPIEAHLFACDRCAAASEQLGLLVAQLRELIPPVISHAHRDRLAARGTRLRHTDVEGGRDAEAVFGHDIDLLIHVLKAELTDAERIDLDVLDASGAPRLQFLDVPFDRTRGEVLIACQRHFQSWGEDPTFRINVYEGSLRRALPTYFVRHIWQ